MNTLFINSLYCNDCRIIAFIAFYASILHSLPCSSQARQTRAKQSGATGEMGAVAFYMYPLTIPTPKKPFILYYFYSFPVIHKTPLGFNLLPMTRVIV